MNILNHSGIVYNEKYADKYNMDYIFNSDKIVSDNNILNTNNIGTHILNYTNIINLLQYHFSSNKMLEYYGNKNNLTGVQTRNLYKYLLDYYFKLFLSRMNELTNINVLNIDNEDDTYTCFIAKCMNIIRGSIKKYVRLRTSSTQPYWCKKKYLENRNSKKYGCPIPVKEYEYCPSFAILKQRGKTCKQILHSSMRTNDIYTMLSDLCIIPPRKNVTIRSANIPSANIKQSRSTRKRRTMYKINTNILLPIKTGKTLKIKKGQV